MSNRPPFPEENAQPPRQKLTEDEYRVLRECNQESFFQRCLPMGIGAMIATQVLVNKGIWKAHPKYGSLLKLSGAGLFGYIAGKASYQQKCREKILRLENSPLADAFRQQRPDLLPDLFIPRGKQVYNNDPRIIPPPHPSEIHQKPAAPIEVNDDYMSTGSLNDDQNHQFAGLSDHLRPNVDRDIVPSAREESGTSSQQGISYADLQQRNRDKFAASTATAMHRPPPVAPPTSEHAFPPQTQQSRIPVKRVIKNQYGDVIDD